MRGVVDSLSSGVPLGEQLPAVLQEDEFAQRLVSAFDVALAPIISTLDDLDAYIDPHVAPDDFVDWVGTWVGVDLPYAWDLPRRREIVAGAVASYQRDGSVKGIRFAVELATNGTVEITDTGGASWSSTPDSPLPGGGDSGVHVRVVVDDPAQVDERRLNALVASIKPAHVVHTVEVVGR
jgi:phage tail-like protein